MIPPRPKIDIRLNTAMKWQMFHQITTDNSYDDGDPGLGPFALLPMSLVDFYGMRTESDGSLNPVEVNYAKTSN
jgi:hypothetical protein